MIIIVRRAVPRAYPVHIYLAVVHYVRSLNQKPGIGKCLGCRSQPNNPADHRLSLGVKREIYSHLALDSLIFQMTDGNFEDPSILGGYKVVEAVTCPLLERSQHIPRSMRGQSGGGHWGEGDKFMPGTGVSSVLFWHVQD